MPSRILLSQIRVPFKDSYGTFMNLIKRMQEIGADKCDIHREDTCYREFIRSNHFVLNNLSWNFTEVIMNANKVIPENLFAVS